jgi:MFS family permease
MSQPTAFKRLLLLASIGGGLEMYDFVIYLYLSPIIASLFFKDNTHFVALMLTFSVFAMGYLVRPLGGLLFGSFGDRYGRKNVFLFTLLLMSLPVLVITFLPVEAQIGLWAPILFLLCRIIQGLAVGGEIPGAMTFINEHAHPNHRGFASGFLYFGLNTGIAFAAFFVVFLQKWLSPEHMLSIGWRIPFLFGALIGLVAAYLRRTVHESPLFLALQKNKEKLFSFGKLFSLWPTLLRGIGITSLGAVTIIMGFTYLNEYFRLLGRGHYHTWIVAATFLSACLQVAAGALSDKIGRIRLLKIAVVATLISIGPIYWLFSIHQAHAVIAALMLMAVLGAFIIGVYPALLIELFPTEVRYSGYAFSYNVGFAIFGGLSPLFASYLILTTGNPLSPAICFFITALLAFVALIGLHDKKGKTLH